MSSKDVVKKGRPLVISERLSFETPSNLLFKNLDLTISEGEIVAITGQSGSGKSVLLRILQEAETPTAGTIEWPGELKISYVPQFLDQITLSPQATIEELFYQARGLVEVSQREKASAERLSYDTSEEAITTHAEAHEAYAKLGGYKAEADAQSIIAGLQIGRRITLATKLNELSSGQRTKLLIGQALFAHPDLLIMDDPTSNLDVQSREWLGQYIKRLKCGTVIATNDAEFMTHFASRIIEILRTGRVLSFEGTYPEFVEKRDRLIEAEEKEAKHAAKKIEELQETVNKFKSDVKVSSSRDMARVRTVLIRRVARMEEEHSQLPGAQLPQEKRIKQLFFEPEVRSGDSIISIRGISKIYGEVIALDQPNLELDIRRGDKIGIVGRNGAGKSTLLRTIFETYKGVTKQEGVRGNIQWGLNLELGYYSPGAEEFSPAHTVMQETQTALADKDRIDVGRIRAVLQFFGFDTRDIEYVKAIFLSKGERVQLSLAKLMLRKPNVLILDEPTDGLSDEVKARLLTAVKEYKGTLLLVSHELDFYSQVGIGKEVQLPLGKVRYR